jgi:hypothetical protein
MHWQPFVEQQSLSKTPSLVAASPRKESPDFILTSSDYPRPTLTPHDSIQRNRRSPPLGVVDRRNSRLLRRSFITYEKGQMIKFQDVKRPAYDLYRTETYDPAAKITPGQTNLRPLEDEFLPERKHQDLADGLQALQGRSQLDSF